MILPEIRFANITDNEFCSPYDGRTMILLESDPEAMEIIKYFATLYDDQSTSRYVPGYSLRRKIASEFNLFGDFHRSLTPDFSRSPYPDSVTDKVDEIIKCDQLIDRLLGIASKLKTRTLRPSQLSLIAGHGNGIVFTSKILTEKGMRATVGTFTNFPEEVYSKAQFLWLKESSATKKKKIIKGGPDQKL